MRSREQELTSSANLYSDNAEGLRDLNVAIIGGQGCAGHSGSGADRASTSTTIRNYSGRPARNSPTAWFQTVG